MTMKVLSALAAGLIVGASATYFATTRSTDQTWGAASSGNVLSLDGKSYTIEDLPPAAARALHDVDTHSWLQKKQVLASTAVEIFIGDKIKATGGDRQEVMLDVLGIKEVSEGDLKEFYEQRRDQIAAEFDQVKGQISAYLMGQQVRKKRAELSERLRLEHGMRVTLPEPVAPLTVINTEGFPVKGDPDAAVTIVEFADYQCPHCKDANETLDQLMGELGVSVRMVYIDFPINSSGISRQVALGGVCADEQGKFWEYNKAAYDQQPSLTAESPAQLAEKLNLDAKAFQACMDSDRPEQRVAKAEKEAERLGLSGTPAVFVNGKAVQPHNMHDDLKTAVKVAAGVLVRLQ